MKRVNWFSWVPILITAFLMYLAKITNLGVVHYNVFLLLLLLWTLLVIFYYRNTTRKLRGRQDE